MLVCSVYITWLKPFKLWKLPTVVSSIMVLSALTLLHFMWDLKAPQINMQQRLIQKFILYEFKVGHNFMKATKSICCTKGEGSVDHSTVSQMVKETLLRLQELWILRLWSKPVIVVVDLHDLHKIFWGSWMWIVPEIC